jgi:hypothetical protein
LTLIPGAFENQSYEIGGQKVSLEINKSTIESSQVCTSDDIAYLVFIAAANAGQSTDFISYDESTKTVSWESSSAADAGTFEIKIVSIINSVSTT